MGRLRQICFLPKLLAMAMVSMAVVVWHSLAGMLQRKHPQATKMLRSQYIFVT